MAQSENYSVCAYKHTRIHYADSHRARVQRCNCATSAVAVAVARCQICLMDDVNARVTCVLKCARRSVQVFVRFIKTGTQNANTPNEFSANSPRSARNNGAASRCAGDAKNANQCSHLTCAAHTAHTILKQHKPGHRISARNSYPKPLLSTKRNTNNNIVGNNSRNKIFNKQKNTSTIANIPFQSKQQAHDCCYYRFCGADRRRCALRQLIIFPPLVMEIVFTRTMLRTRELCTGATGTWCTFC